MSSGTLSVRAVGDAVAAVHGIGWRDLVRPADDDARAARRVAASLALRWTSVGPASIGRILGVRDVAGAARTVAADPRAYPRLAACTAALSGIADTLARLGIRSPDDVDPLDVAIRLLLPRPHTVPIEHLQVLAAYLVGLAAEGTIPLEETSHAA